MPGSQDFVDDPRNQQVMVYVNGDFVPRDLASVSVFDSGFGFGDGIWDSFRLYKGRLVFADLHLDRLFRGLRAVDIDPGLSKDELLAAVIETLRVNGMVDGVHVRLMITRGLRRTPNQDPRQAVGGPTVVIVAEYKQPSTVVSSTGLALFTSSFRCARPDMLAMHLNSHSRLPLILALQQAIRAGADEALMLDADGYVSSCNSTNFFFVAGGRVQTSTGRASFPGITRAHLIELCRRHAIPVELGDFTLEAVYGADEAFVTGTFGGVTPVQSVDGRQLAPIPGTMTRRLQDLYARLVEEQVGVPVA